MNGMDEVGNLCFLSKVSKQFSVTKRRNWLLQKSYKSLCSFSCKKY